MGASFENYHKDMFIQANHPTHNAGFFVPSEEDRDKTEEDNLAAVTTLCKEGLN